MTFGVRLALSSFEGRLAVAFDQPSRSLNDSYVSLR